MSATVSARTAKRNEKKSSKRPTEIKMHQGHEIVKCECGKVIRQCRCMDPFKSTVIQRPCKCEKVEEEDE